VTGALVTAEQATSPGYWAEHMCSPCGSARAEDPAHRLTWCCSSWVLGSRSVRCARFTPTAAGPLEPGGVVPAGVSDPREPPRCWPKRGPALADRCPARLEAYQGDRAVAKVGLPGYPFQRQRYWIDALAVRPAIPAARPAAEAARPERREGHVQLMRQQWTQAAIRCRASPAGRCVLLGEEGQQASRIAAMLAARLRDGGAEVTFMGSGRDILAERSGQQQPDLVIDLRPWTRRIREPTDAGW